MAVRLPPHAPAPPPTLPTAPTSRLLGPRSSLPQTLVLPPGAATVMVRLLALYLGAMHACSTQLAHARPQSRPQPCCRPQSCCLAAKSRCLQCLRMRRVQQCLADLGQSRVSPLITTVEASHTIHTADCGSLNPRP